jgi:hypothetical protein
MTVEHYIYFGVIWIIIKSIIGNLSVWRLLFSPPDVNYFSHRILHSYAPPLPFRPIRPSFPRPMRPVFYRPSPRFPAPFSGLSSIISTVSRGPTLVTKKTQGWASAPRRVSAPFHSCSYPDFHSQITSEWPPKRGCVGTVTEMVGQIG